ncbi:hypothetical protein A2619_04035 [candidate division WWE3 bacterium RIFOXYD1_FULL_39_9]|uniref:Uncharacterized protein n=1 Tax=candidate division WWE3 bacterium RIFOXYD1_FULL_39_9 TaxID=1802649 RepID=A0A1F4X9G0_UNCKA|nr:MAG: hypothetical protein A2619_04035 [candidate division WWE3 bacterium RIFOXYD1_FULL_39_9]
MEKEKLYSQLLGESPSKQWYELFPERFEEEKLAFQTQYPNFRHYISDNGEACWDGEIGCSDESGQIKIPKSLSYNPLKVRVVCKRDYPLSFPKVIDLNKVLKRLGCEHIMGTGKEDQTICYAFRPSTELDFIGKHSLVDVVPVVQTFLLKFYCKQLTGMWPGGEHLHDANAFIVWEYEHGEFSPSEICPCSLHGEQYKKCHFPRVRARLFQLRSIYPTWVQLIDIGRNDKCGCGSGKKFKKCGLLGFCDTTAKTFKLDKDAIFGVGELETVLSEIPFL